MTLAQARKEAIKETANDKYIVKHVNYRVKNNTYYVSDWYDSDSTVASYQNGTLKSL